LERHKANYNPNDCWPADGHDPSDGDRCTRHRAGHSDQSRYSGPGRHIRQRRYHERDFQHYDLYRELGNEAYRGRVGTRGTDGSEPPLQLFNQAAGVDWLPSHAQLQAIFFRSSSEGNMW
jgi:hypothetical protein